MPVNSGPVLLYDGECGLCCAVVRRLARADRRAALRFAPLQGEFAQVALRRCGLPAQDFDSLVFLPEAEEPAFHLRTGGVILALECLGGGWAATARVLAGVPAPWREVVYRGVARMRHRIFGRVRYRPGEPVNPARPEQFLA